MIYKIRFNKFIVPFYLHCNKYKLDTSTHYKSISTSFSRLKKNSINIKTCESVLQLNKNLITLQIMFASSCKRFLINFCLFFHCYLSKSGGGTGGFP